MLLELRTVSRKTPGDGRLEISAESARRLAPFGERLTVRVGGEAEVVGEGRVTSMTCTCEKGGGGEGGHEHHFLASDLFRSLAPGETVGIELLDRGVLHIALPHPL